MISISNYSESNYFHKDRDTNTEHFTQFYNWTIPNCLYLLQNLFMVDSFDSTLLWNVLYSFWIDFSAHTLNIYCNTICETNQCFSITFKYIWQETFNKIMNWSSINAGRCRLRSIRRLSRRPLLQTGHHHHHCHTTEPTDTKSQRKSNFSTHFTTTNKDHIIFYTLIQFRNKKLLCLNVFSSIKFIWNFIETLFSNLILKQKWCF